MKFKLTNCQSEKFGVHLLVKERPPEAKIIKKGGKAKEQGRATTNIQNDEINNLRNINGRKNHPKARIDRHKHKY